MTALQQPYGLIFEDLVDEVGAGRTLVGWNGEWPPPERMHVFLGSSSGDRAYVGSDELEDPIKAEYVRACRLHPTILERVFVRRSYSSFTAETAGDHIWPCAQYVEVGFDYAGDGRVVADADR